MQFGRVNSYGNILMCIRSRFTILELHVINCEIKFLGPLYNLVKKTEVRFLLLYASEKRGELKVFIQVHCF